MIRGFSVQSAKYRAADLPQEDAYAFDDSSGAIVVADGVTRDPMRVLPDVNTPHGWRRFASSYPRPSGAKMAADLFCESFIRHVSSSRGDGARIQKAFSESNRLIGDLNQRENPQSDFVIHDYFACVAAGVVDGPEPNSFSYGYVSDCGVAILDRHGNLSFRTKNEGADRSKPQRRRLFQSLGLNWSDPAARWITRKVYRNNPAEVLSCGAFTGEDAALYFIRTGVRERDTRDLLLVYSDGLEPVIFQEDGDVCGTFVTILRAALNDGELMRLKRLCAEHVAGEGTLVVSSEGC